MKGTGAILLILGGVLLLSVRRGVKNIDLSIIDFKIDNQKSNLNRIVTDLKIEALNPERISGEIEYVFLTVKNASGDTLATFEGPENIVFNKQSRFLISIEMEIKTGRFVSEIITFFAGGGNQYPVNIAGYIQTNIGRINIQETKNLI